jgi:hypothetical protein
MPAHQGYGRVGRNPGASWRIWCKAAGAEVTMNNRDELIRGKLLDRLTAMNVDACNPVVAVAVGTVTAQGTVATPEERERAMAALIGAHTLEIAVRPA